MGASCSRQTPLSEESCMQRQGRLIQAWWLRSGRPYPLSTFQQQIRSWLPQPVRLSSEAHTWWQVEVEESQVGAGRSWSNGKQAVAEEGSWR